MIYGELWVWRGYGFVVIVPEILLGGFAPDTFCARGRSRFLKNTGIGAVRSRAYKAPYTIQPRESVRVRVRGAVARTAYGMKGRVR